MVLGVYLAAWRRWFSLKPQVEELEAGPGTARTQSADLGALVADLRLEIPSVGVEHSMGHRRVQFTQGPHGESRSVGLCTWLYVVISPHSQPSISSPLNVQPFAELGKLGKRLGAWQHEEHALQV